MYGDALYNPMYMELEAKGEIVAAEFLCDMIKAVAKELKKAERMHLMLWVIGRG